MCSSIQDLLEVLGSKVAMTWNMLLQQAKPPKRLIMSPPREAIKWCEYHVRAILYLLSCFRELSLDLLKDPHLRCVMRTSYSAIRVSTLKPQKHEPMIQINNGGSPTFGTFVL